MGHPILEAAAACPSQPQHHHEKGIHTLSPDVSMDTEDESDEGTDVGANLN
jgi:hypothetical protein